MTQAPGTLYVIACGTLAARDIGKLVTQAQDAGWAVCVVATPASLDFIDRDALAAQTGHPVRHAYKQPDAPDELPPADAMIVGGASFNTINKWANGISDTLALGMLNEALGLALPIVVLPFLNSALAGHPAFGRSVATLREAGVTVLLGPGVYEPQAPKTGQQALAHYPWQATLDELWAHVPRRG
jgi:phosphopantothenoylcysteine synthetase/decarboxylase